MSDPLTKQRTVKQPTEQSTENITQSNISAQNDEKSKKPMSELKKSN